MGSKTKKREIKWVSRPENKNKKKKKRERDKVGFPPRKQKQKKQNKDSRTREAQFLIFSLMPGFIFSGFCYLFGQYKFLVNPFIHILPINFSNLSGSRKKYLSSYFLPPVSLTPTK